MSLNSPRTILTESPTRGLALLLLYFSLRSLERADPNFMVIFSHYDGRQIGDPGPLFCGLAGHRALDVCPLQVPFRGDYDGGVVFEDDSLSADPPNGVLLPDDHRSEDGLLQVGWPFLHHADDRVAHRCCGDPAPPAFVPRDLDDPQGLGSGVVCAVDNSIDGNRTGDVILELLDPLGRDCTGLRRHQRPLLLDSTTTKEMVFESGLHSPMVTVSPSATSMHPGMWALTLLLRLSPLLYLRTMCRWSISTTAKPAPAVETALPVKSLPLTLMVPWNGHLSSWHFFFGTVTSRPAELIFGGLPICPPGDRRCLSLIPPCQSKGPGRPALASPP